MSSHSLQHHRGCLIEGEVNARGEVVGLIFDGNIQLLVGDFNYDEAQNRAVSVHSSALIEALRHVYDAGPLADELQVGEKHASR